jgi:hypothetical protein
VVIRAGFCSEVSQLFNDLWPEYNRHIILKTHIATAEVSLANLDGYIDHAFLTRNGLRDTSQWTEPRRSTKRWLERCSDRRAYDIATQAMTIKRSSRVGRRRRATREMSRRRTAMNERATREIATTTMVRDWEPSPSTLLNMMLWRELMTRDQKRFKRSVDISTIHSFIHPLCFVMLRWDDGQVKIPFVTRTRYIFR